MRQLRILSACLSLVIMQLAVISIFGATAVAQAKESANAAKSDDAVDALKRMHAYVKTSQDVNFSVTFNTTDRVLGTSNHGTAQFSTRQPNKLRVKIAARGKSLLIVSDGETLSIYSPDKKRFTQSPTKDSIVGTLYTAAGLTGIPGRILDFFWTVDYLQTFGRANTPKKIGDLKVGDRTCRGIRVIRSDDRFDVWLEKSDPPVPCKLVTRRADGSADRVETFLFTWNKSPSFGPDTFSFSPPAGAKEGATALEMD